MEYYIVLIVVVIVLKMVFWSCFFYFRAQRVRRCQQQAATTPRVVIVNAPPGTRIPQQGRQSYNDRSAIVDHAEPMGMAAGPPPYAQVVKGDGNHPRANPEPGAYPKPGAYPQHEDDSWSQGMNSSTSYPTAPPPPAGAGAALPYNPIPPPMPAESKA